MPKPRVLSARVDHERSRVWDIKRGWLVVGDERTKSVYQSGFLPKIPGILLMAACIGDWIGVAQVFLFSGFEVITYPGFLVAVIAEFTFCGWLMVKGVKETEQVLSGASS